MTSTTTTTQESSSSYSSWPPHSLAMSGSSSSMMIANYCEDWEVFGAGSSNYDKDMFVLVHMAALLHHQDWLGARDLFLRQQASEGTAILKPWYDVAVTALAGDWAGVWNALQALSLSLQQQQQTVLPEVLVPIATTYVQEIAHAVRVACLKPWWLANRASSTSLSSVVSWTEPIPCYYVSALGFASRDELVAFAVQAQEEQQVHNNPTVRSGGSSDMTQIVSFLESRMVATVPLDGTNNNSKSAGASSLAAPAGAL